MNRALKISMTIVLITSIVVLLGFVNSRKAIKTCASVNIEIDHESGVSFITEDQVLAIAEEHCNNDTSEISVRNIEKHLLEIPVVKSCDVYMDLNGLMHISIKQRQPVARIYFEDGNEQYMDTEGKLMPVTYGAPVRVIIINGKIASPLSFKALANPADSLSNTTIGDELFAITQDIQAKEFWKAMIEQVYRNENGEYVLIPKVGGQEIIVGDAGNVKEKLEKLMLFYEKGMTKKGWEEYKTLNIKFKNQVIARKKGIVNTNEKDSITTTNH